MTENLVKWLRALRAEFVEKREESGRLRVKETKEIKMKNNFLRVKKFTS
jgi:hypothetical protein